MYFALAPDRAFVGRATISRYLFRHSLGGPGCQCFREWRKWGVSRQVVVAKNPTTTARLFASLLPSISRGAGPDGGITGRAAVDGRGLVAGAVPAGETG